MMRATRTIAPPTAIPAIAPLGSDLEECVLVGLGNARVGDRAAMDACCVKYTERSLLLNPAAGAVAVAPPEGLNNFSGELGNPEARNNLRATNFSYDFWRDHVRGSVQLIWTPYP